MAGGTFDDAGSDPSELLPRDSTHSLVEVGRHDLFVKAWFLRPVEGEDRETALLGWLPLQPPSLPGVSTSVIWFVLQLVILLVAALAYWYRPYDRPLRMFLITSLTALVAFVGGNHWWVIAGNLWLLVPFTVAAILLPAVLLHFFLLYPSPRRWTVQRSLAVITGVYGLPVIAATGAVFCILAGSWWTHSGGDHPLGQIVERCGTQWVQLLLPVLRSGISWYLGIAAVYFLLSLASLMNAYQNAKQRSEHEQIRWILWAASLATLPLGYALMMAYQDQVEFAFGGAQIPLFFASLLFTAAYAVGIVRFRLMLIDQVLNRGLLYYLVSFSLTLLFSVTVAYGSMRMLHQDVSAIGQPALIFVVANVAVILLVWLRDRVQRSVDREFFREKYPLDKALQRVNQAVTGMLDRRTLAERVLLSCRDVLQADRGAIYLRDEQTRMFRQLAAFGEGVFPREFSASREFVETLRTGHSLQRVRSGASAIQQAVRSLDAELIHGLDVDGDLAGMVVLGAKPNAAGYTAEDAAFIAAMGRIAGVTLHFGKVHEDLTRMNGELVRLNDELSRRSVDAAQIQEQIRLRDEALAQRQREIDALQQQLRLRQPDEALMDTDPGSPFEAPTILGNSPSIRQVLETVRKVAASEASVLVRGESGTGKELLARAIHENSPRHDGPLVSIHCAALAPGVLESELFGHVRGAFTDARQDKPGRFQLAHGGTLFLDEIGDVPLETQVKLLRVLQERVIEPVGSARAVPVDVRLIAATHRPLEQFIAEGRFREDLYYRLNVVSITLPPLRERGDDIIELAVQFLRRAAQRNGKPVSHFDEGVLDRFRRYPWPGNIRELENVVERAVVLAERDTISLDDLPPVVRTLTPPTGRNDSAPQVMVSARSTSRGNLPSFPVVPAEDRSATTLAAPPIDALFGPAGVAPVIGSDEERQLLKAALEQANGNKAQAAKLLGMPRSTYFSKLRKHGLE